MRHEGYLTLITQRSISFAKRERALTNTCRHEKKNWTFFKHFSAVPKNGDFPADSPSNYRRSKAGLKCSPKTLTKWLNCCNLERVSWLPKKGLFCVQWKKKIVSSRWKCQRPQQFSAAKYSSFWWRKTLMTFVLPLLDLLPAKQEVWNVSLDFGWHEDAIERHVCVFLSLSNTNRLYTKGLCTYA